MVHSCGLEAVIRISWTNRNPSRRFYGCPTLWFDPPMCQKSVQIIPSLLRSRKEFEEILAMVEEKRLNLKLWMSSSRLAVLDGGRYLWIKAFLRRSQVLTITGVILSTYLLTDPVRVNGNIRVSTASFDTPGILNKLTMLRTRST
ncbi:hypothetical protein Tco_0019941 [Tanacetum coccineum]